MHVLYIHSSTTLKADKLKQKFLYSRSFLETLRSCAFEVDRFRLVLYSSHFWTVNFTELHRFSVDWKCFCRPPLTFGFLWSFLRATVSLLRVLAAYRIVTVPTTDLQEAGLDTSNINEVDLRGIRADNITRLNTFDLSPLFNSPLCVWSVTY